MTEGMICLLDKTWKQFKSGTDIRGVALEGVAGEEVTLTDPVLARMADGFVLWMSAKTGKTPAELTLSVGHDSRLSAQRIKGVLLARLTRAGCRVLDCGLSSTPAMFMTTVDLGCDGAVQITASHHPFHRNGLKFFTREGGLDGGDIEAILQYAQDGAKPNANPGGQAVPTNYMAQYAARLRKMICDGVKAEDFDRPLEGFRIVVDAGNGAGGFYASEVLAPLGADTLGSQFLEPDGRFPNHIPNPEDEEAMASICAATLANEADLGVIFDTDVDRAGCVDSSGREINRNRLVALAASIVLDQNAGGTIVTDSVTSTGLREFIQNHLHGVHHRFRRGYRNVINEAQRLCAEGINAPLAIETSGHAALRENYFLDDGAYLITKIIIKMARLRRSHKTLDDLIAPLKEPAETAEMRMAIKVEDFKAYGGQVIEALKGFAREHDGWECAKDNHEGVRIECDAGSGDGWLLLRMSVHDPIMPLNVESDSEGGVQIMVQTLNGLLQGFHGLDTYPLTQYLEEHD